MSAVHPGSDVGLADRLTGSLYDPTFEHDACGVAFVADLSGRRSHDVVINALTALRNLEHRGATGREIDTGDGAGLLTQIPDAFLRAVAGFELPPIGSYAVGTAFLPTDNFEAAAAVAAVEQIVVEENLVLLGWRDVPFVAELAGPSARAVMPRFRQLFVAPVDSSLTDVALDRLAFRARKRAEREASVYFASLSSRTLVYKGMLTAPQVEPFFPDLSDHRFESALALVHSRFSTNTFPSWPLAHPYRFIAHNGEINTIKGNRNWMRARETLLSSDLIPGDLNQLFPICTPDGSDSMSFDEVLELLHLGGRSLPHAVLMMIPEAWEKHAEMEPARRAFYEFHASLMEPWDGPACVTFTDGTLIGAVLDRNGLRPARYWVTDTGLVVLASEVGVLDLDPASIVRKGRLQPGKMFLVDTAARPRSLPMTPPSRTELAAAQALRRVAARRAAAPRRTCPESRTRRVHRHESVLRFANRFSATPKRSCGSAARADGDAVAPSRSGRWVPTPRSAALSARNQRLLFDYFSELFAQVTNPPLDAIREQMVTSLSGAIGPEHNLLAPGPASCRQVVLPEPGDRATTTWPRSWHVNADGDLPGLAPCQLIRRALPASLGGGERHYKPRLERVQICEEVSDGGRRPAPGS